MRDGRFDGKERERREGIEIKNILRERLLEGRYGFSIEGLKRFQSYNFVMTD